MGTVFREVRRLRAEGPRAEGWRGDCAAFGGDEVFASVMAGCPMLAAAGLSALSPRPCIRPPALACAPCSEDEAFAWVMPGCPMLAVASLSALSLQP